MNSTIDFYYNFPRQKSRFSITTERKILKIFLLACLHQIFCDAFKDKMQIDDNFLPECYTMDSKIIQLLIRGIIETEQYTLEGIAYYTRIPLDVICDAASGLKCQFSITPWMRIVDLYMQVKPDVAQKIIEKLISIKNKNSAEFSNLLNDT